ncbi:flagellar rod assembly protein/muramidase FlgJ [Litchfieldella qijiaojingensis]|uniref:Peptidoglycan hydrolase FlgJ n=1 Tax=Litchfieldella qijiaojingensis TaxID=980347 RepID=A0ABQ2YBL7_9GAMM|nr:flagellar assembly peptidoglycan hydrolase FlgJ [Halomonas qijiaojingensis]GGX78010.1 flagellar rod assembly protein/muramidase FlgJ [Halomonas qijiaojingensis]
MSVNDLGDQFALDMQGIQRLKHTARQDPNAGLDEAARQFEALFLQMMLKSMREATPQSDLLNSQQTEFYTSLLDQQWSQHMAGRGIGLAEQLINQLEGRGNLPRQSSAQSQAEELIAGIPKGTPRVLTGGLSVDGEVSGESDGHRFGEALDTDLPGHFMDELNARLPGEASETARVEQGAASGNGRPEHVQHFLDKLTAPAQAASSTTGVPAELILAQAALETGWGRHEIPTAKGGNSHNLFGIKAGSGWQGETTDITTHEYVDGQRIRMTETFRVYDSFEEAFTDYARLIGDNPRYAKVVTAADAQQAARALQQGGYATDPAYADKLVAIMSTLGPLEDRALTQDRTRVVPRDVAAERTPGSIF